MATYTIDQYQRKMRGMAKQLQKAAKKSARDAAQFMANTARGMAPIKSGELRQGIVAKPIKDAEYEVSSTVPKDFPYNLWINQTAPYRTIHPWWNARQSTVYGDGSHINTGTPRFWHLATLRTYNLFGKIARKNIQKALRVTIG